MAERPTLQRKKKRKTRLNEIIIYMCFVGLFFSSFSIFHRAKHATGTKIIAHNIGNDFIGDPIPVVKNSYNNIVQDVPINQSTENENNGNEEPSSVLTAYLEPINFDDWEKKPLPIRTTKSKDLKKVTFPQLNSCSKLPSQWPVDNYPEEDAFLPWIHDVFPSDDGKMIRFVAQNRRRCNTGKYMGETKKKMQPSISIFQSVPVKRVFGDNTKIEDDEDDYGRGPTSSPVRYQLTSYEDADKDGMETRFICRFKPSLQETLSTYPFNYDYHTYRKGYMSTFTFEGFDNHIIWTSQLIFDCPVPPELWDIVRSGSSVINDYATMFVDLIPIRTPPRYGPPRSFLPPRFELKNEISAKEEWGENHLLPLIENSGRWENIPICKTSLQTYGLDNVNKDQNADVNSNTQIKNEFANIFEAKGEESEPSNRHYAPQKKIHDLIACTWTSSTFTTRGDRAKINDGKRRLHEWLTFHFLAGFDHIYIYDNTGAFSETDSLKSVTDSFPGRVTRINWPSKVCNNRPNNADNKGERSSQYAAETSCRLRFGAHSTWLGAMDTDEYLVPVGKYNDLKTLLTDLDEQGLNIYSFHSQRANPRYDLLSLPRQESFSFEPEVSEQSFFFETYNCHREKPRKTFVPAEKQIYKTDYVLLHHIHYSTITLISQLSQSQTNEIGYSWRQRYAEKHVRFSDEENEALMLHTKSVVEDQTRRYTRTCKDINQHTQCKLGFPWPNGEVSLTHTTNKEGFFYNCFIDDKIETYWVPRLRDEMIRSPIFFELL